MQNILRVAIRDETIIHEHIVRGSIFPGLQLAQLRNLALVTAGGTGKGGLQRDLQRGTGTGDLTRSG